MLVDKVAERFYFQLRKKMATIIEFMDSPLVTWVSVSESYAVIEPGISLGKWLAHVCVCDGDIGCSLYCACMLRCS